MGELITIEDVKNRFVTVRGEVSLLGGVGYYGTERFIVMMNRAPGDYTAWHEAQGDSEETIEELGAKIMAFDRATAPCETVGSL